MNRYEKQFIDMDYTNENSVHSAQDIIFITVPIKAHHY